MDIVLFQRLFLHNWPTLESFVKRLWISDSGRVSFHSILSCYDLFMSCYEQFPTVCTNSRKKALLRRAFFRDLVQTVRNSPSPRATWSSTMFLSRGKTWGTRTTTNFLYHFSLTFCLNSPC